MKASQNGIGRPSASAAPGAAPAGTASLRKRGVRATTAMTTIPRTAGTLDAIWGAPAIVSAYIAAAMKRAGDDDEREAPADGVHTAVDVGDERAADDDDRSEEERHVRGDDLALDSGY